MLHPLGYLTYPTEHIPQIYHQLFDALWAVKHYPGFQEI